MEICWEPGTVEEVIAVLMTRETEAAVGVGGPRPGGGGETAKVGISKTKTSGCQVTPNGEVAGEAMVESSQGLVVGLGEAILVDHVSNHIIKPVKEGIGDELRPLFPFIGGDDHLPGEVVLMEDVSQALLDAA